jgi:hypothetical protein
MTSPVMPSRNRNTFGEIMRRYRYRPGITFPADPDTTDRIAAVADATGRKHRLTHKNNRWRNYVMDSAEIPAACTVLAMDDYSHIPFVKSVVGVAWYQYRSRLRCGQGDYYAVTRPAIEGYESYNHDFLGLGRANLILAPRSSNELELAHRLQRDDTTFQQIRQLHKKSKPLIIHPYMSIQPVWELAEALSEGLKNPVRVLGPPPPVTRLVNSKSAFSDIVAHLLGDDALAHTRMSNDPKEIAENLCVYIHRFSTVALKMPSCASGLGNQIFAAHALRNKPMRTFHTVVQRFLEEKEWNGRERVLTVEWHRRPLESPSTQCWIPALGEGLPQVEGVFQQFLIGPERIFEGAVVSGLPQQFWRDFCIKSWQLCCVFQQLGYVGRCSFDALVVGPNWRKGRIKFVECNGRWGGTSTPMHLMKRVFGDFRAMPYKARDYVDARLQGMDFPALMELFGEHLYDHRTGKGRILLYNVGGVTEHGKFDIIATGRSYPDAIRFLEERVAHIIDRYLQGRPAGRRAIL